MQNIFINGTGRSIGVRIIQNNRRHFCLKPAKVRQPFASNLQNRSAKKLCRRAARTIDQPRQRTEQQVLAIRI